MIAGAATARGNDESAAGTERFAPRASTTPASPDRGRFSIRAQRRDARLECRRRLGTGARGKTTGRRRTRRRVGPRGGGGGWRWAWRRGRIRPWWRSRATDARGDPRDDGGGPHPRAAGRCGVPRSMHVTETDGLVRFEDSNRTVCSRSPRFGARTATLAMRERSGGEGEWKSDKLEVDRTTRAAA